MKGYIIVTSAFSSTRGCVVACGSRFSQSPYKRPYAYLSVRAAARDRETRCPLPCTKLKICESWRMASQSRLPLPLARWPHWNLQSQDSLGRSARTRAPGAQRARNKPSLLLCVCTGHSLDLHLAAALLLLGLLLLLLVGALRQQLLEALVLHAQLARRVWRAGGALRDARGVAGWQQQRCGVTERRRER